MVRSLLRPLLRGRCAPVSARLHRRQLVRHLEEIHLARGLRLLPPASPLLLCGTRVHLVPRWQRGPTAFASFAAALAGLAALAVLAVLAALTRIAAWLSRLIRKSNLPLRAIGPNVAQLPALVAVLAAVVDFHGRRRIALAVPGFASEARLALAFALLVAELVVDKRIQVAQATHRAESLKFIPVSLLDLLTCLLTWMLFTFGS